MIKPKPCPKCGGELKHGTMPVIRVGIYDGRLFCLKCFDALDSEDLAKPFEYEGELVCWNCQMGGNLQTMKCQCRHAVTDHDYEAKVKK